MILSRYDGTRINTEKPDVNGLSAAIRFFRVDPRAIDAD
jgi:hypothetical protein